MALRQDPKLTRRAASAAKAATQGARRNTSAAQAGGGLWETLTRPIGDEEQPLSLASYGTWAFVLAYGILRWFSMSAAALHGPEAILAIVRTTAIIGLPMGVLGMTAGVIAFIRGEQRLWMAVGGFAVSALIAILSYLEISGKLIGMLASKLPGV
jgi:hypothetical protein